jgi:hypothetical protein
VSCSPLAAMAGNTVALSIVAVCVTALKR